MTNKELIKLALDQRIPKVTDTDSAIEVLSGHVSDGNITEEEFIGYLEQIGVEVTDELLKPVKTAKLDAQCMASIFEGFTLDLGDGEKHFKCDLLNQSNIDNLWMNAQLVQQGAPLPEGTSLEYNTSDDECLENLTVEQCLAIWVAKNTHVYKYRKQCELDKKALKNE